MKNIATKALFAGAIALASFNVNATFTAQELLLADQAETASRISSVNVDNFTITSTQYTAFYDAVALIVPRANDWTVPGNAGPAAGDFLIDNFWRAGAIDASVLAAANPAAIPQDPPADPEVRAQLVAKMMLRLHAGGRAGDTAAANQAYANIFLGTGKHATTGALAAVDGDHPQITEETIELEDFVKILVNPALGVL